MVEVFKTNVQRKKQAAIILNALAQQFPLFRINFDLDDCDKILRVEGKNICCEKIIEMVVSRGHQCNILE